MIYKPPLFCFDTADAKYIANTWEKLKGKTVGRSVEGITTNPNAFDKVGVKTIADIEAYIKDLAQVLKNINSRGTIHMQVPVSTVSIHDLNRWAHFVENLSVKYEFRPVVKIPPRLSLLKGLPAGGVVRYNVTGLTDACTCNTLLTYSMVKYVSIIPGRMEEIKLDADNHLISIALSEYNNLSGYKHVVAGSMRTVYGLKKAIRYKTLPTIGTRVWDTMTDEDYESFPNWWQEEAKLPDFIVAPPADIKNVELSVGFFETMDALGQSLWEDFNK